MAERVNCFGCRHFKITWDRMRPYGCKAWGIRSKKHPCQVVFAASGIPCQLFQPKHPKNGTE
ncbi:uracil-DNA glycosylase [Desulfoglaeba alkanexedens ALDC]|uniref:Uracil-DNA glycosylase n=1 Tax=Desulfoglaeba alkanexedens ALDC TaxID=980445 RepID=A0A4P8L7S9_9BACT|nr:uracil-DNA glycosylase [Desulfoglaeba alkanexedens ALDC]